MTLLPELLGCNQFVNADEIAHGLSPFDPASVAFTAGRIMLARVAILMAARATFAIETTLANTLVCPTGQGRAQGRLYSRAAVRMACQPPGRKGTSGKACGRGRSRHSRPYNRTALCRRAGQPLRRVHAHSRLLDYCRQLPGPVRNRSLDIENRKPNDLFANKSHL